MIDASNAGLYKESAKKLQGTVIYRTLLESDTTLFVVKVAITKDDVYIKNGQIIELTPIPLRQLPNYNLGEHIIVAYDPINPIFFYAYDILPSSRGRLSTYWWVFLIMGFATWALQMFNFNTKN
jgi:hypothetical protein